MRLVTDKNGSIDGAEHTPGRFVPYVYWSRDEICATLDGRFTAEELELIAKHMRANYLPTF